MQMKRFPVIDLAATGENIIRLRQARGLTVRDVQAYFGFEEPQAIYKWQRGKSLPTVDNLYALSDLLEVPMNDILVSKPDYTDCKQQAEACCSTFLGLQPAPSDTTEVQVYFGHLSSSSVLRCLSEGRRSGQGQRKAMCPNNQLCPHLRDELVCSQSDHGDVSLYSGKRVDTAWAKNVLRGAWWLTPRSLISSFIH